MRLRCFFELQTTWRCLKFTQTVFTLQFTAFFPLADQSFGHSSGCPTCMLQPTSASDTTAHHSTVAVLHAARDLVTDSDRKAS